MQLVNHFYKITNNKALQLSILIGLCDKMWFTSQVQFLWVYKITWNLSKCWTIQGTTASDRRWNGTVPAVNNSITLVLSSYNTVNDLRVKVTIFWVYSHHHVESRLSMQWYDLEVSETWLFSTIFSSTIFLLYCTWV